MNRMKIDRRTFLGSLASGLSGLGSLSLKGQSVGLDYQIPATAKRVIYLFMAGGPSQLETFDYKPAMKDQFDRDLPDSIRRGQRVTNMTAKQTRFPIASPFTSFQQYGQSGAWVSELLPYTTRMVDDLSIIKTLHTEAINHDPAKTLLCTGSQLPGQASLGAWLSYALGSGNPNLPDFVVLNTSRWTANVSTQALFARLWGSGFLPSRYQGVTFQNSGDPVLYLSNPEGIGSVTRGKMIDLTRALNRKHLTEIGDPEISTTIAQQEMAYRMQASIPELADMSHEPASVKSLYGPDVEIPGTFAYNCLLARRMAERNVRCVQLFHRGWDQHSDLPDRIKGQCLDTDQASYALITDLKQRGLLDDTLVVWAGEFGRTIYCQGKLTQTNFGRDHHPRCFSVWMAGGGVKGGITHGETDEFSYNIVRDPVHIHDLNATILHCLGINHRKLTFPFRGLDARLTGVEPARVVRPVLA